MVPIQKNDNAGERILIFSAKQDRKDGHNRATFSALPDETEEKQRWG